MPETNCGFKDSPGTSGSLLLVANGPTLFVDIGFDPNFNPAAPGPPVPGIKSQWALVDTGATESCIDNLLAATLNLPVVDRRPIGGVGGVHEANMYLAQVRVPSLDFTQYGLFAGVNLSEGGQRHRALIGRTFLRRYTMVYNGVTGSVTLSRPD